MRRLSTFVLAVSLAGPFFFLTHSATARAQSKVLTAAAQTRDEAVPAKYAARLREFGEYVRRQMAADRTTALTIGFVKDGYVWVKGYGYADLENKTPARSESAYRLASVTKPMTAVAVLQLAERGKIKLDAEVQNIRPLLPEEEVARHRAPAPRPPRRHQPLPRLRRGGAHQGAQGHTRRARHLRELRPRRRAGHALQLFVTTATTSSARSSRARPGKSYGDYMRENVWSPPG